jgi:hypothetical protein
MEEKKKNKRSCSFVSCFKYFESVATNCYDEKIKNIDKFLECELLFSSGSLPSSSCNKIHRMKYKNCLPQNWRGRKILRNRPKGRTSTGCWWEH